MKFYEIRPDTIINLFTVRTAQVRDREIYLSYTCGDARTEVIHFPNNQDAADAFDRLCDELGVEVKNED